MAASVPMASDDTHTLSFEAAIILAVLTHLFVVGLGFLLFWILQLLGINIPLFNPPVPKQDIEFVLVENPKAPPRDRNTKNRAEHATRAGGVKTKQPQAETVQKAGNPSPKRSAAAPRQQPRPQVRPQPRPQPQPKAQQPIRRPTPVTPPTPPTPKVSADPPPAPKLPTPRTSAVSKAPTLPPNPIAPLIKVPSAPSPKLIATGPIVHTPGAGSGSASSASGSVGPSQIPGSVSSGGGLSGTRGGYGSSGSGGRGSYSQTGSAGGGGGRAGIDALPDPDYGAYMAELQRRIKRHWQPPQAQESKKVVVIFRIDRSGRLLSLNVKGTSGFVEADHAALEAVKLSAPFRPLPVGHPDNDLAVEFTFDYNVFRGGNGSLNYR